MAGRGFSDFSRLSVSPTPRSDYQPQVYKSAYFRAEIGTIHPARRVSVSGAGEKGVKIINFRGIIAGLDSKGSGLESQKI